jgi:hypothetical protein
MTVRAQALADAINLSTDIGVELEIYRNGVLLRTVTGCYAPRPEAITTYAMENTVQRASITILDPVAADGLLVNDIVVVPNVGDRKLYGKPRVNAFGWTTWELTGA